MKRILLIAALISLQPAWACECPDAFRDLNKGFQKARYVVRVRVTSVGEFNTDHFGQVVVSYAQVSVAQVYKGTGLPPTLAIGGEGSSCDFAFRKGREYVLFVEQVGQQYRTSACVPNFEPSNTTALRQVERLAAAK